MKRFASIALWAFLCVSAMGAVRDAALTFDVQNNANLNMQHKSYTGLKISGTVTDSVANAYVDLTGQTGTMGFKTTLGSTSFLAEVAIVLVDASNGTFSATFPQAQWNTNITTQTRLWGDVRFSSLGNTLPSVEMWLHP